MTKPLRGESSLGSARQSSQRPADVNKALPSPGVGWPPDFLENSSCDICEVLTSNAFHLFLTLLFATLAIMRFAERQVPELSPAQATAPTFAVGSPSGLRKQPPENARTSDAADSAL
ncbi:uncharacterized protein LOC119594070 isoform X2 [Penaeus monodon]|uniref:uncharacterized protein LOC119594070 isoform X2 n=1 Tax=Penaeus monodon TaxID=6687 RepID=UPI0018A7A7BF|nr:uncharacterized protein LOC119594070 isoform X2 [Penaeus monodon]